MSLNPGKGPSDLSDANLEGVGPRARGPPGLRTSQASKQEREREREREKERTAFAALALSKA